MSLEKFTVSNGERDYEFTTAFSKVEGFGDVHVLDVHDAKSKSNVQFTYFIRDDWLFALDSLLPVYQFLSYHNLQPNFIKLGLLPLDDFLKRYFAEAPLLIEEATERGLFSKDKRGRLVLSGVDLSIYRWFIYRQLEYLSRNDPVAFKRHFDENLLNLIDMHEGVWESEFLPSLELYRDVCASRTEFLDKCFEIWKQVENLDIVHNHLGDEIIKVIVEVVADIKRVDLQSSDGSVRQLVWNLMRLALD